MFIVPDHINTSNSAVNTIEPSNLIYTDTIMDNIVSTEAPVLKRRRSSSCDSSTSSLSSCSSSSSSEEEEDTFSMLNSICSRRSSFSSDSEQEDEEQQQQQQQEIMSSFVHRRQMEEMILDKITNHLDPEKLPDILTIISKPHEVEEVEEVEIDLARLDRDQLSRILSYVDACLLEKQGGPKVKISDFTIQPKPNKKIQQQLVECTKKKQRRKRSHRRKSIIEQGHVVSGSSHSQLSASHGPISMSALTEIESNKRTKKPNKKKKQRVKKNDASVRMSSTAIQNETIGIATTKPKRRSAVHKRRLLEEMLQPSSNEEDEKEEEEGGCGIVIFGDEQMDLAVTHNETIEHLQERRSPIVQSSIITEQSTIVSNDEDEEDELIDIMM